MCDICDGMTREDSLRRLDEVVASHGWAIQGVEGTGHQPPWAYTIGLIERFGHPEIVVTDGDLEGGAVLLNSVAEWIAEGDRFVAGTIVEADGYEFEFGRVHPSHLRHGLCAMWSSFYEYRGFDPGTLDVVQLLTASPSTCEHQRAARTVLAVPDGFARSGGPNRAARRRAARGR